MASILVTGATGKVGAPLVAQLRAAGADVRAASRSVNGPGDVRFDFHDRATWGPAFDGVETMFLIRPPDVAKVQELVPPLLVGKQAGLRHVVLLSVQGAGRVKALPHAHVEKWLRESGLSWTFVRPSYFSQNLSTVFAADIRDRDAIVVPAGNGRTAFVDTVDVAAVAAAALLDPAAHREKIWTPTGPALTYTQAAELLSAELGRRITYTKPSIPAFVRHARRQLGMAWPMVAITTVLHVTARFGMAGHETNDVLAVTGRPPITFAEFAHREREVWLRP